MPLIQQNPSQLLRNVAEREPYISREDFVQELHDQSASAPDRSAHDVSSIGSIFRGLREIVRREEE
jgi:hypothetical protein